MPAFIVLVLGVIGVWIMILTVVGFTPIEPSPAKRFRLIVLYAAILHYVWAVSVTLDARAGEATSLAGLAWLLGPRWLAPTLFVVASLSLVYVFFSPARMHVAVFALPQQAVLLLSAWSAIVAMSEGHFADGVARPIPFIVADQAPAVIVAVLHAAAITLGYWRSSTVAEGR